MNWRHLTPWLASLLVALIVTVPGRGEAKAPRDVAQDFAGSVFEAAKITAEQHVQGPALADLTDSAIRGLYRHLDEGVPADITARLAKVKDLRDGELVRLLADARA